MALGLSRDILFILRAKDEVSRTLTDVERAFGGFSGGVAAKLDAMSRSAMAVGGTMAAAGAAAAGLMSKTTSDFMAYEKQAALTKTQMVGMPGTIEEIMKATSNLYKVGAPLKELQPALYDIFSSMPVSGLDEATKILTLFTKSAVAGGTDVQTAGRTAISVMNAWGMGSEDLTHILDTQWRLVQKGVGSYEEVANALGRALPSAQRAGQGFDQVSASMAFMTRAGLSNAMAATSTARAMDLLSNPVFRKNMQAIGLDTLDAAGNFKDMSEVVRDLHDKLGGLTEGERAKALKDLTFKAGGTIQAMRFLDLAVTQGGNYLDLLGEIQNSTGALDEAYGILADTGATKTQVFKNRLKLLSIELGQRFLPYVMKAMDHVQRWIDKWDALNPKTKDLITKIIAMTAGIGGLGGSFLMIVGTIGKLIAALMGTNPWVLAIAAAIFLIYKNWDRVGPYILAGLQKLKDALIWVKDAVMLFIGAFTGKGAETGVLTDKWVDRIIYFGTVARHIFDVVKNWIVNDFVPAVIKVWNYLWENVPKWVAKAWQIIKAIWDALVKAWDATWNAVKIGIEHIISWWNTFIGGIQAGATWFWTTFGPGIMRVWDALARNIPPLLQSIVNVVNTAWDIILRVVGIVWPIIVTIVETAVKVIWEVIKIVLNIITTFWDNWGTHLWSFIKDIWNAITTIIAGALDVVFGIIRLVMDLVTGHWSKVWEDIKGILNGALELIEGIITTAWNIIQLIWDTAIALIKTAWETFWDTIKGIVQIAVDLIEGIVTILWDTLKSIFNWIIDIFAAGLKGAWDGISGAVTKMWDTIKGPLEAMWDILKKIGDVAGGIAGKIGGFIGKLGDLPGLATGGTLGPGLTWVGEQGPELVYSSGGSGYVMNRRDSYNAVQDAMNGGGGSVIFQPGAINMSFGNDIGAAQAEAIINRQLTMLANKIKGRK